MIVDLIEIMDRGYDAKPAQDWPIIGTGEPLDRTKYVTASEIGKCSRMVKFNKLAMIDAGYVPELGTKNKSTDDWGFFERGHTMEAWCVQMIHDGWDNPDMDLLHTGKNQVSFVSFDQSGTPDGVFLSEDGTKIGILEVKSFDPRSNTRFFPRKDHVDQVTQNLDLAAEYYNAVPLGGEIIYVDASNYKRRIPHHIRWSDNDAEKLQEKANRIMCAATPEDLDPEGLYNGGCRYCAHKEACSAIVNVNLERNEKGANNDHEQASKKFFG